MFEISYTLANNECLNVESVSNKVKLWHIRYGHICQSNLEKLIQNKMVEGIDDIKVNKVEFCESCIRGKLTRSKFVGNRSKAKRILETVHTDGSKYFLTFIDDFSNFVYVCIYN